MSCLLLIACATAPLVFAASPVCCRLFGIDATRLLGGDPAICGAVPDAETSAEAREARNRATRCALAAQAEGKAFVYTYRELIEPRVDLVVQALIGAHGDRLLLKMGRYFAEDIRTIEVCQQITVKPDGRLASAGCTDAPWLVDELPALP